MTAVPVRWLTVFLDFPAASFGAGAAFWREVTGSELSPLHGRLRAATDIHGETGLDGPAFGEPTVQVEPADAAEFMRTVILAADRPVTLVATGPLTNVAALLLAHPEAAGPLGEIVVMGGSTERGNVTARGDRAAAERAGRGEARRRGLLGPGRGRRSRPGLAEQGGRLSAA